ncbi:hypothetical protein SAMN04487972_109103 [Paracoccus halophilus]|uniref:Uncharacterized protein n=1 Tax=Paracoccus halophilus TaxID=376733 RepID=A0A1I0TKQ7_9RHOB|nr:hypothetical protein SAMN04487972_109103 [Paracoccus halophilus]
MGRSTTAKTPGPCDAISKVARQRMIVFELARELGNVAEACRPRGMDRTSILRMEAAVLDPGLRRAEGAVADPQVASAADLAGGGGEDQGLCPFPVHAREDRPDRCRADRPVHAVPTASWSTAAGREFAYSQALDYRQVADPGHAQTAFGADRGAQEARHSRRRRGHGCSPQGPCRIPRSVSLSGGSKASLRSRKLRQQRQGFCGPSPGLERSARPC